MTASIVLPFAATFAPRYVIPRSYNVPLRTIVAYNIVEMGLFVLSHDTFAHLLGYYHKDTKGKTYYNLPLHYRLFMQIITALGASYATSFMEHRIPFGVAVLTTLSGTIASSISSDIAAYFFPEKPNQQAK